MATSGLPERYKRLEIPDRVTFIEGSGELPKIRVTTPTSEAEIYLHGAHVTHFQKTGEPPLLFLSKFSRFAQDQPIRGGIPLIFPWFGPREGEPMHGFARLVDWDLTESLITPKNAVKLRFTLPDCPHAALYPPSSLECSITVADTLTIEATVQNRSKDNPFPLEVCFHTYFAVADIRSVQIKGLKGVTYLDKVKDFAQSTETSDAVQISSEVDRIYLDTPAAVKIVDPGHNRTIHVDKAGSNSTVVWNPWIKKAQRMPDLGDEEYLNLVCVESGNVGKNSLTLAPGRSTSLKLELSSSS